MTRKLMLSKEMNVRRVKDTHLIQLEKASNPASNNAAC